MRVWLIIKALALEEGEEEEEEITEVTVLDIRLQSPP